MIGVAVVDLWDGGSKTRRWRQHLRQEQIGRVPAEAFPELVVDAVPRALTDPRADFSPCSRA